MWRGRSHLALIIIIIIIGLRFVSASEDVIGDPDFSSAVTTDDNATAWLGQLRIR